MFQPVLSPVACDVVLNQAYNVSECDVNDVPSECRLYQRLSIDEKPCEWWDDEQDHVEYEHLIERLYVQGVRAVLLS